MGVLIPRLQTSIDVCFGFHLIKSKDPSLCPTGGMNRFRVLLLFFRFLLQVVIITSWANACTGARVCVCKS